MVMDISEYLQWKVCFCVCRAAGGKDKSRNFHILVVATLSKERKKEFVVIPQRVGTH